MTLSEQHLAMRESSGWDFSDLNTLFLNCTPKRSPELSHTKDLIRISQAIMEKNGRKLVQLFFATTSLKKDSGVNVDPDAIRDVERCAGWTSVHRQVGASTGTAPPLSPP